MDRIVSAKNISLNDWKIIAKNIGFNDLESIEKNYKETDIEVTIKKMKEIMKKINYPDKPCIIVKCIELSDQNECDANRTPVQYLKSAKELENRKFDYSYEVWLINEDGSIDLEVSLGTYPC